MTEYVKCMFHPTFMVPSLEESEEFFQRVFARPSKLLEVMPRNDAPRDENSPKGYSKFTMIADVLIDCVQPTLHITDGVQHFPSVDEPVLSNTGWYSDDIDATFRALRAAGIPLVSQFGDKAEGDAAPAPQQGGGAPRPGFGMFFADSAELGVRFQFISYTPLPVDPRSQPGWSLPPVSDDDPLGIERTSHHTVLTQYPDRGVKMLQALGGKVVVENGRDELRKTTGTYVRLSDAVLNFAKPDEGSAGAAAIADRPAGKYHAVTFKIVDLDRAAQHLESVGVKIAERSADTIITESSASTFNVPWGFTTAALPG
jgi:hypothetical protein